MGSLCSLQLPFCKLRWSPVCTKRLSGLVYVSSLHRLNRKKTWSFREPRSAGMGLEIPATPLADLGSPFQGCLADHHSNTGSETPVSALGHDPREHHSCTTRMCLTILLFCVSAGYEWGPSRCICGRADAQVLACITFIALLKRERTEFIVRSLLATWERFHFGLKCWIPYGEGGVWWPPGETTRTRSGDHGQGTQHTKPPDELKYSSGADILVIDQPEHRLSEMFFSNPFSFPSSFCLAAHSSHGEELPFPAFRLALFVPLDLHLAPLHPPCSCCLASLHSPSSSALSQPELGRVLQRGAALLTNRFWSVRFGSRLGAVSFVLRAKHRAGNLANGGFFAKRSI